MIVMKGIENVHKEVNRTDDAPRALAGKRKKGAHGTERLEENGGIKELQPL